MSPSPGRVRSADERTETTSGVERTTLGVKRPGTTISASAPPGIDTSTSSSPAAPSSAGSAGGVSAGAGSGSAGWASAAGDTSAGERSRRSEDHTTELQSTMRISYVVFTLKKNNTTYSQSPSSKTRDDLLRVRK